MRTCERGGTKRSQNAISDTKMVAEKVEAIERLAARLRAAGQQFRENSIAAAQRLGEEWLSTKAEAIGRGRKTLPIDQIARAAGYTRPWLEFCQHLREHPEEYIEADNWYRTVGQNEGWRARNREGADYARSVMRLHAKAKRGERPNVERTTGTTTIRTQLATSEEGLHFFRDRCIELVGECSRLVERIGEDSPALRKIENQIERFENRPHGALDVSGDEGHGRRTGYEGAARAD